MVSPDWNIPDAGVYLWEWYESLSSGSNRVIDGVAKRIPWREFSAWAELTGTIVTPPEYDILRKMDLAYCAALDEEITNARAIAEAKNQPKGRGR